jgi:hypothetical protein
VNAFEIFEGAGFMGEFFAIAIFTGSPLTDNPHRITQEQIA